MHQSPRLEAKGGARGPACLRSPKYQWSRPVVYAPKYVPSSAVAPPNITSLAVDKSLLLPSVAVSVWPHRGPGLSPRTVKRRATGTGLVASALEAIIYFYYRGTRRIWRSIVIWRGLGMGVDAGERLLTRRGCLATLYSGQHGKRIRLLCDNGHANVCEFVNG